MGYCVLAGGGAGYGMGGAGARWFDSMTDADAKKWACPGHEVRQAGANELRHCSICEATPGEIAMMDKERAITRRRGDKAIKYRPHQGRK